MKKKIRIILRIVALFVAAEIVSSGVVFGQTFNSIKPETKNTIDSIFNAKIEAKKTVGVSIAIVDNEKVVYSNGYGYSNKEEEIKASDQSIYRVGSITKSFTALSLLKLQEEQKLSLDDPIQKYIPELTIKSDFDTDNNIYIKDILTHTSGLPNDILNGMFTEELPKNEWIIDALNKQKMASPRNYFTSYSNVGYMLLGELIERESGMNYSEYINKEIFQSLGMKNSTVNKNIPVSYLKNEQIQESSVIPSIGGINSNVLDMSKFMMMMINKGKSSSGKLMHKTSINEMEKERFTKTKLLDDWEGTAYALTVQEVTVNNKKNSTKEVKMYGHGGDTPSFHADYKYIPELKVGVVVMSNTDAGYVSARSVLLDYLNTEKELKAKLSVVNRAQFQEAKTEIPSPKEILGTYTIGTYKVDVDSIDRFHLKIGSFTADFEKQNDSLFYFIPQLNQKYRFVKVGNEILVKSVSVHTGREGYVGNKFDNKQITDSWKNRLGKYEAINAISCGEAKTFNFSTAKLELKETDGVLQAFLQSKTNDSLPQPFFKIVDDSTAQEAGIGRNTGTYLMVLDNGNLYYNGFEFKRIKSAL
ncbi:beta-lactamase family protein [Flammeovirga yaeyamensis]|uniref:Beta-lactamase family protein n=1 Tax=Flammeovirga yaeyamensis TaxID=367791 RepID=A0AAX1N312_9BACT|nr:serine hydrolase domain-containing protein [Flammeovirga yaeyamensis]MBB3701171.1 CubicO group peptidase (beta-lactamase class C family) [Flammeovirga yaeyamensis]NMF38362.1 beta-lactamase family protein [Flammeovirga yaeyamensis]QWG01637.1 beta-lactamase family protein [Flammeovirga yaeyamensis]